MLSLLVTQLVVQGRRHMPLLLGAGAGLTLLDGVGLREVSLGVSVLLLAASLVSLLYYRRFHFRVEEGVLVIRKGLLEHREFRVAARHVQHTAIYQPFYMRPFGVVEWQVETMAGEAARIALPGIHRVIAEALSGALQPLSAGCAASMPLATEATSVASTHGEPDDPEQKQKESGGVPRLRFAITPGALVLHGLTNRSVVVVAAMLSPLIRPLEHWLHDVAPQLELRDWLPVSPPLALAVGLVVAVAMLMTLSVLAAWWRFHGYRLHDDGERQVQSSGLLQRQEQTLSLDRLQVVEWVQTGLGRALGRGYLVCWQFGGASGGDDAARRRFLVPGLAEDQSLALMDSLWPGITLERPLARVSVHYRRVLLARGTLLACAALAGLAGVLAIGESSLAAWQWLALGGSAAVVVGGVAQRRWQSLGWVREGRYMRVRHGLIGQRTSVFPLCHVISLRVQQSWLQRRRGLATLHLFLAHGRVSLPFIDRELAHALADRLLADMAPS